MASYFYYWVGLVISSYITLLFLVRSINRLWWRPKYIEQHFSKQGIKGPPYQFFIGNLKELVNLNIKASSQPMPLSHNILPRVLSFYHHWRKIYGAAFLVWFGPTPRITISDPALIREVFILRSDFFEKNDSPPLVRKLEGNGLLTLKGEKWAHHRKIIAPTFYIENLKLMISAIGKSMEEMLDKWSAMSTVDGKAEIEVSKWFQSFAEEVLTRTTFGSSYEDGRTIFNLQAQQMAHAMDSFHKASIPGYRFLPTKNNRISGKLDKEIRKSLMKLVHQRKKSSCNQVGYSDECPRDLLEQMIKSSLKETNCTVSGSVSPASCSSSSLTLKDNDMVEECKSLFFAGKQTTANLMTWATILLAMHPQWQDKAREEVLKLCGGRNLPTKDDLAKLKILGMILNESLRLYPPVVAIIRRAKFDVQLGGLLIPRGMELLIPILAVHHDQVLWGQDSTKFNPARFFKGVGQAATHPMAFMPFGLGTRRCIGQNLAVLQAKLAISMILQRFSFDLSPSYQHAPRVLMMLHPQYGASLNFYRL